jgi:hypothetical protein
VRSDGAPGQEPLACEKSFAVSWLLGHASPDLEFLRSIRTERIPSTAPKVMTYPIRFVGSSAPVGIGISGGIEVKSGASRRSGESRQGPRSRSARSEPAFVVSRVEVSGQPLLKIDLSTILGD